MNELLQKNAGGLKCLMRQVLEPKRWVHRTSIKIEANVHYFVTILEHNVNTQLLTLFIHDINKLLLSKTFYSFSRFKIQDSNLLKPNGSNR